MLKHLKIIRGAGAVFVACFLFYGVSAVRAAETIRHYNVTAIVHKDGQVDVTEDIEVNAENNQIEHGIYREIPTDYNIRLGVRVHTPFSLKAVLRDGVTEPHHEMDMANGLRIYAGHKDVYVSKGIHHYTFRYTVARVVGFFDGYDEFYWNVTGNGWIFPIENAHIRVVFPEGAVVGQNAAYTGGFGAQGRNYKSFAQGNVYEAQITKTLGPHEGFTVAASIQKGILQPETQLQSILYFIKDNAIWAVLLISTSALFVFLFLSWRRVGKDTEGVTFPRFDVPTGVTPDMLRYIVKQGYDSKVFACLLVNGAVKKYISIDDEKNETIFTQIKDLPLDVKSGGDMGVLGFLFQGRKTLTVPKKRFLSKEVSEAVAQDIQSGIYRHKKFLAVTERKYFSKNTKIKGYAILIIIGAALISWVVGQTDNEKFSYFMAALCLQGGMIWSFWRPLNKRTSEGQSLADYAAGLKLYLSVAEEARMNVLYPKTITPEIFETLLPYALALDVEQEWCEYFAGLVAAGSAVYMDNGNNRSWYRSHQGYGLVNLGSSLDGLGSVISSASSPSRSSSGSRGGGSSGGGGGGGGGGGW